MGYIKINQDRVTKEAVKELKELCPFNAFDYIDAYLSINAACKICRICLKKGPEGICEFVEEKKELINKELYKSLQKIE